MRYLVLVLLLVATWCCEPAMGSDYDGRVMQAETAAQHAVCEAEALPTLLPWPQYELFRTLALGDANDARIAADRAAMYGACADTAWKAYSYQMVLKVTNQMYYPSKLAEAKATYDGYVAKTLSLCDEAEYDARASLQQTANCRLLLDQ